MSRPRIKLTLNDMSRSASPVKRSTKNGTAAAGISGLPADSNGHNPYAAKAKLSGLPDTRMGTARNALLDDEDIHMGTARAGGTARGGTFQLWERELLESNEVKRKATVAQLCACS